jgi:hypothetical protein
MPPPSIDYLNERRESEPASGGVNHKARENATYQRAIRERDAMSEKEIKGRLCCTECGRLADVASGCDCGADYKYLSAGDLAAAAVKAHPDKSDRAIADEIGISAMTVGRARAKAATVTNVTVEKRTDKNGVARKLPERKPPPDLSQMKKQGVEGPVTKVGFGMAQRVDRTAEVAKAIQEGHALYDEIERLMKLFEDALPETLKKLQASGVAMDSLVIPLTQMMTASWISAAVGRAKAAVVDQQSAAPPAQATVEGTSTTH